MDNDLSVSEDPNPYADIPEGIRPAERMPRWPWIVAIVLLLIGIAIAIAWPITLPYYTYSPGPVYDTSDFITVEGGEPSENGELYFLTISLKEANIFEWAAAHFDEAVTLSPRENIRPADVSPEQLRRESLARMEQSQQDAIFVALTKLGYEVTYIGTGALVIDTVPESGSDGVLLPNDVIVQMDGEVIAFRDDIINQLGDKAIGDIVEMDVQRPDEDDPATSADIELEITLGPHTEDPSRPMLGVYLDNAEVIADFPIDVDFVDQGVGGPSAGLMFTLQIMDQLTEESISNGYRIAGTGTIDTDGTVGNIGGVHQKVFGAIDSGARVVLVPSGNYADAVAAAGDAIEVVEVATIDDALEYLASL